jgi:hypothetical protein
MSPQNGMEFENSDSTTQSTLQRSNDGGRTWRPESRCSVDASVGGLPRKLDCRLYDAQFLSPTVGFAGGGAAIDMGTSAATFGRTTDGGKTWTMSLIPETKRHATDVMFWTEKEGIVVLEKGEEVYWTGDGGTTWTRSVKQRLWPSLHAVGEGRIIVGIGEGGGIGYSFNGGRNFTSRPLALPARALAVTFPDAQHGYLVGQHAMVYRYRIVPIDYTRQGMIAAMAPEPHGTGRGCDETRWAGRQQAFRLNQAWVTWRVGESATEWVQFADSPSHQLSNFQQYDSAAGDLCRFDRSRNRERGIGRRRG